MKTCFLTQFLIGINYAQLTAFLIEVSKAQQAELLMVKDKWLMADTTNTQQQAELDEVKAKNAELTATLQNLLQRMEKLEQAAE